MKLILIFIATSPLLFGCAASPGNFGKAETQARSRADDSFVLTEIVRNDQLSRSLCGDVNPGEICRATWAESVQFCKDQGMHLPTAREYAELLRSQGTRTIEIAEVPDGKAPAEYYLVDCENEDGTKDAFYMNHSEYRRPESLVGNHLLWTA